MPAGATYEPIATTTLSSSQSNITFSGISGSYTDLRIVVTFTTTSAGAYTRFRLNSDTGSNYSYTRISGNGSAASSGRATSTTFGTVAGQYGSSTTIPTLSILDFFSYAGSTNKTVLTNANEDQNGNGIVARFVNLWRNTNAITAIELTPDVGSFASGSTATLYGIKNSA